MAKQRRLGTFLGALAVMDPVDPQEFLGACLWAFSEGASMEHHHVLSTTASQGGLAGVDGTPALYASACTGLLGGHVGPDMPSLSYDDQCRFLIWLSSILFDGSPSLQSETLHVLGIHFMMNDQPIFGRSALKVALNVRRRSAAGLPEVIDSLTQLAVAFDLTGRAARARRLLALACKLSDDQPMESRQRDACLRLYAAACALDGDMRTALVRLGQAEPLCEDAYAVPVINAETAWTIAICRQGFGAPSIKGTLAYVMASALTELSREWAPMEKFHEVEGVVHALGRTSRSHFTVLAARTAVRLMLECQLDLNVEDTAITWNNFGNALLGVQWNQDAITSFRQIVEMPLSGLGADDRLELVRQQMHANGGIGFANYNLAFKTTDVPSRQRAFVKAAAAFDQAAQCREECGSVAWFEGRIWACAGLVHAHLGSRELAFREFARALVAGRVNWGGDAAADVLSRLLNSDSDIRLKVMEGLQLLGALHSAILFGKAAVHAVHRESLPEMGVELSDDYVRSRSSVHRTLVECLTEVGRHNEAEQAYALLREDAFAMYVKRTDVVPEVETSVALSRAEVQGIRDSGLASIIDGLSARAEVSDDAISTLAVALQALDGCIDAKMSALRRTNQDDDAHIVGDIANLLGPTAARLRYLAGSTNLKIVVDAGGRRSVTSLEVSYIALSSLTFSLRQTCRFPSAKGSRAFLSDSRQLHDFLIVPILSQLDGIHHIYVEVDNPLDGLPFAALHDGRRFLFEDFSISYLTSSGKSRPCSSAQPRVTVFPCSELPGARLPGAALEAHAVARGIGRCGLPAEVEALSHADCTKQAFLDRLSQANQLHSALHLATHAEFNATSDTMSVLALADGNLSIRRLRRELADRGCDTGLFVLSACGTARQDLDVDGFSATLLRAGVGSVVASLWETLDTSAPGFFEEFYAACDDFSSPRGVAQAVRRAQCQFQNGDESLDGSGLGNPWHWAPYVVISGHM